MAALTTTIFTKPFFITEMFCPLESRNGWDKLAALSKWAIEEKNQNCHFLLKIPQKDHAHITARGCVAQWLRAWILEPVCWLPAV